MKKTFLALICISLCSCSLITIKPGPKIVQTTTTTTAIIDDQVVEETKVVNKPFTIANTKPTYAGEARVYETLSDGRKVMEHTILYPSGRQEKIYVIQE